MTIWLFAMAITISWSPSQTAPLDPANAQVAQQAPGLGTGNASNQAQQSSTTDPVADQTPANSGVRAGLEPEQERPQASSLDVAMLARPGGDANQLGALFEYWTRKLAPAPFPRIIAIEPGPLTLSNGLRILPNEFLPKAKIPKLLILDLDPRQNLGNLALAFIRRTLSEGGEVWVIGEVLPEGLRSRDLTGKVPLLINGAELGSKLMAQAF